MWERAYPYFPFLRTESQTGQNCNKLCVREMIDYEIMIRNIKNEHSWQIARK